MPIVHALHPLTDSRKRTEVKDVAKSAVELPKLHVARQVRQSQVGSSKKRVLHAWPPKLTVTVGISTCLEKFGALAKGLGLECQNDIALCTFISKLKSMKRML